MPTVVDRGDGVGVLVRPARPSDTATVLALVRELAEYEGAADQVEAGEADLNEALFAPGARAHALVAELGGEVVGTAVYFLSFSTWTGRHGLYLEDLYVRPAARRRGVGRALLGALASEALSRGLPRLEWSVLDWNEPAISFYRALGATPMDEWTTFRVTGEALGALGGDPGPGAAPGPVG